MLGTWELGCARWRCGGGEAACAPGLWIREPIVEVMLVWFEARVRGRRNRGRSLVAERGVNKVSVMRTDVSDTRDVQLELGDPLGDGRPTPNRVQSPTSLGQFARAAQPAAHAESSPSWGKINGVLTMNGATFGWSRFSLQIVSGKEFCINSLCLLCGYLQ